MHLKIMAAAVVALFILPTPTMAQGRGHSGAMPSGAMGAGPMQSPDMMNGRGPMQSDMMRDRALQRPSTIEATPELRREHREKRQAEAHIAPQGVQHANENAGFDQSSTTQPGSLAPKADQHREKDSEKEKLRAHSPQKSKKAATK